MQIRNADTTEVDQLARIWYDGWQDAHANILPAELARHRTLKSFNDRLQAAMATVRVAGPSGQPLGFYMTHRDELHQLYVTADSRGAGVAAALLNDAEERLSERGVKTAWLACAIGNERAARFYEKHGWRRIGIRTVELPTPDGLFPLEVWHYQKQLDFAARPAVSVAHVVLETDRIEASATFMRTLGMRAIFEGPDTAVFELRGGTHLILMRKDQTSAGEAAFDLMVDDLHATHQRLQAQGLEPSPIEPRPAINHEIFTVREPSGKRITFFSSHASGKPV